MLRLLVCLFFAFILGLVVLACSDRLTLGEPSVGPSVVQPLESREVLPVTLQEVVDTYALGGVRTDLQREAMTAKLVGAAVVWRIKIYDVSREGDRYRVISTLMESAEESAFGKVSVVAFVTPRQESDIDILLKQQAGTEINIRGKVNDITLRTAAVLSPAVLVR